MIKRRLKFQYVWLFLGIFVIIPLLTIGMLVNKSLEEPELEPDYIPEEIVHNSLPVINETKKIIMPYIDATVTVGKDYYDYQAEEQDQINSIIMHDNTYMQNTGIDYINENKFEVVAILEGTVKNIKEDDLVGKTIEIEHENEMISIYQSLDEIKVKKGDYVSQGQVIGTSGTNELDNELGNHLHFEIYEKGQNVDPNNYLNKEIATKKEN